jgi:hypothetical protein
LALLLWWCAGILTGAFSLLLWARPASAQLEEDELYWLGSAHYFTLFQRGDWRSPDWTLLPARENPPVAKYVLGLGLGASGRSVENLDLLGSFYLLFERMPHAWGTGDEFAKRQAVVDRMSPEVRNHLRSGRTWSLDPGLLRSGRITMLVCAALLGMVLFAACLAESAPLGGMLAVALVLNHPAVVHAYNHALSDMIAVLLSALAAFACHRLLATIDAPERTRVPLLCAATAFALALACGAKMNSLVVVALAVTALGTEAWSRRTQPRQRTRVLRAGIAIALGAGLLFVAVNPAILNDPAAGLAATVREHRLTESIQARFLHDHLGTLSAKISAVADLTRLGWPGLIALTLSAAGALCTKSSALRFIALWFLIALITVALWIPFPRSRYILPLVTPAALLISALISAGLPRVRRALSAPRPSLPRPPVAVV